MGGEGVLKRQTNWGRPIIGDGVQIMPQSELVQLQRPFLTFSWQRPTALLIERANQTQRLPLWDFTRLIQGGLLSLAVLFIVIGKVFGNRKRKDSDESTSK